MEHLLTPAALTSLLSLTFLEVMLSIDNVIFVSIFMGRVPEAQQALARRVWMVAGLVMRTVLILGIGWLIRQSEHPLFSVLGYSFTLRDLIMMAGGLFLMVKTVSEIHEKLEGEKHQQESGIQASLFSILTQIVLIDTVFSFDSLIAAVGMVKEVPIMIIAILIAMFVMFVFAQRISTFIHKHPTFKMLALSFLLLIGFTLFFDGFASVHKSEIPKGYVYFSMVFAFGVELLNMQVRTKTSRPVELREPVLKDK
jgi:predicted tellurium resistance membrane protein TerC